MEFKTTKRILYRIEPNPEGGFTARSTDPSVAPLEAPTREELQRKVQEKIANEMLSGLGGRTLRLGNRIANFNFEVERKPEGNNTFRSAGTILSGAADSADKNAQDTKLVADIIAKNFPEISRELATSGGTTKLIQVSQRQQDVIVDVTRQRLGPTFTKLLQPSGHTKDVTTGDGAVSPMVNRPIIPEASGSWKILVILTTLLLLGALFYFLRQH